MRGFDRNGSRVWVPFVSPPYAPALENDFRGMVKTAMRVKPENDLFVYGNKSFNEKKVYYTDAGFFSFFSFPLLKGDPATVLKDPNSVVLTETTAKKYFGSEDPIGKVMEMDRHQLLKVTGIAKDVPANSHLAFNIIVPIAGYSDRKWFENWPANSMYTYVLLNQPADKDKLAGMFPQFMQKYMGERMKQTHSKLALSLTPLKDIYFEASAFPSDSSRHGDKKVVYIFLSIAALILLIACINFMNLSTVRAVERSREVGLRKVLGALRRQLAWQFIGESFLLVIISTALAVGLAVLVLPVYNQLLGYSLTVSWNTRPMYLFLAGVIIVAGLLAGSYPALVLSGFSPIESLRGKLRHGNGGALFRQVLVVMQFGISVFLIIGTIVIMRQMQYVKSKELGFDKEQTLVVKLDNLSISKNRNAFKSEVLAGAGVESVSLMSGEPGGYHDSHGFLAEGVPEDKPIKLRTEFADIDFVKTLGLKIIAGRDLSAAYATDTASAVLINRTAAGMLGFTPAEAIGKWIRDTGSDTANRRIVGVVEDYNFLSLKQRMDGLVISPDDDRRVAVIKLSPGNIPARLSAVKKVYSRLAPVYPFEYNFLDQNFDKLYKTDLRQQTIISVFSGLAIFIACLGLFGLASFTAAKRTREIGVRKVLGAGVPGIVVLLSKDMLRPVLAATLIAIPAGYYVMAEWLHNFAYRTSLDWWVFALAGLLAAVIAFVTISFQSIKAALANPVKSLKTE
jgi:putative ABC transport system permease protein